MSGGAKHGYMSFGAGAIFALGLWVFVDAAAWAQVSPSQPPLTFPDYLPMVATLLACLIWVGLDWDAVREPDFDTAGASCGRIWIIVAMTIFLSALTGALYILCGNYGALFGVHEVDGVNLYEGASLYPPSAILAQVLLCFGSAIAFAAGRREDYNSSTF